jgi:5-methylcytosine-specific restriction endonuclease McrA
MNVSFDTMPTSERPFAEQGFAVDEMSGYDPSLCVNCDAAMPDDNQGLYCSALCREKAKFVRYARGCLRDGRAHRDPDVVYALRIRMAVILGGGYPPRRSLPRAVRLAVIQRDQGRCRLCGAPGAEVDHIDGSSPDLTNLRLLCQACHRKVTEEGLVPATVEQAEEARALWARVRAVRPHRLCDDEQRWASVWQALLAERREWLESGDVGADEVCIDPSDYDGGFGPGSYFVHVMEKDD